ncbi:type 4a pilus biogenesis protein PilO [Candidatus Binatia bacterium]|nr:type 4a pilus biogenesis protein PilO [Candidatus Binatia bacterium]
MNDFLEGLENLEPSRKIAIAIGVPLLILFAYYLLIVSPRTTRTTQLVAHIEEMEQERDKKKFEAEQMPERQKEVDALDKQLKFALTRLPDEKEIPELLSSISNLGRDSGLEILVFRQLPEGYQEFYAEVPVEMQVRGNYHQVAQFLDRVGKLDRIVNVSNIAMKAPKTVDENVQLDVNSRITTFRFLSEAERQRLIQEKKIKGDAK